MRASFVDVDGVRTRHLHEGREGPALFLLHGVGVSADTFCRNIDGLGRHFRVSAPDMLGHGFTDAVDYGGEPPQRHFVHHLGRLADRLGFETYSVAGSSFGALIAALMYFDRPECVERLILIGTGSVFHPADEQRETLRAAAANGTRAMEQPTIASCRQRLANICYDPSAVAEEILPVQLTSYALPDRLPAYRTTIEGMIEALSSAEPDLDRVYGRLEQMAVPSLVLTGRQDIRAQVRLHEEGVTRMPNATLLVFEECGHLPYMEYPSRFNEVVTGFMTAKQQTYSQADSKQAIGGRKWL